VLWTFSAFACAGLLLALAAAPIYISSTKVMSELGQGGVSGNGLTSALRGFGLTLPGPGSEGSLSTRALPEIVASRQVRLAVARDTFYFPEIGRNTSLVEYLESEANGGSRSIVTVFWGWTVGLPGRIMSAVSSTAAEAPPLGAHSEYLTKNEENAIRWILGTVETVEDDESGLIIISASGSCPFITSQLVSLVAKHLRLRVQEVYTSKTRRNLEFVEGQYHSAGDDLQEADRALAEFQDRNQSLASSQLQLEEEQLRRRVAFKLQLYSELQAQLTQARFELQKSEPVITSIEDPVPARYPSGPNRRFKLILAMFFGLIAGLTLAFIAETVERLNAKPADKAKLTQIRSMIPRLPWTKKRG